MFLDRQWWWWLWFEIRIWLTLTQHTQYTRTYAKIAATVSISHIIQYSTQLLACYVYYPPNGLANIADALSTLVVYNFAAVSVSFASFHFCLSSISTFFHHYLNCWIFFISEKNGRQYFSILCKLSENLNWSIYCIL